MTTWNERTERLCTNWQTVEIGRTMLTWDDLGWFFRVKDGNGRVLSEALAPTLNQAAEAAERNPESRLASLRKEEQTP